MKRWAQSPRALLGLVLVGLALRLVAAEFSRGFLTSDDHHLVVNTAADLAAGRPLSLSNQRSVFYTGAVAAIMVAARDVGIRSPDGVMLLVRLVQAIFSLFAIILVFRILEHTSGREAAFLGGLLTAGFYIFPVLSVHQYEEVVSQVPLLAGCWWWIKAEDASVGRWGPAILSGAAMGIAMSVRPQLLAFVGPVVLLLLYRRSPQLLLCWVLGFLLAVTLQGASNAVINHEWFYTLKRYYRVVTTSRHELFPRPGSYPSGPVWKYVLTLLWVFLPPFSLVAIAAIVKGGRMIPRLGIPALTFFVAHSLIVNKQERFLLPILPVLVILAVAGFPAVEAWFAGRGWSRGYRRLWISFAVVNAMLVLVTIFSYGKKDRVAPLVAIERRGDATGVIVAQYTYKFTLPSYYLGRPAPAIAKLVQRDSLAGDIARIRATGAAMNYVVLYSETTASDSLALASALGAPLHRVAAIAPSLTDRLVHALNPSHNKVATVVVYAI